MEKKIKEFYENMYSELIKIEADKKYYEGRMHGFRAAFEMVEDLVIEISEEEKK